MGWQDDPIVAEAPAPWENDPIVSQPKEASTLAEDFQAGLQGSSLGLAVRGKMPDLVLGAEHSKWYDKLVAGAGQMAGDFIPMAVGGVAGAIEGIPGGALGAAVVGGATSFALPNAIRQHYVEKYTKGEVENWADFLDRVPIILKEAGKGALIGGMTAGTGKATGLAVEGVNIMAGRMGAQGLSPMASASLPLASEVGTLTVAPALLEGHAPNPEDALNAAILIGGFKGAGKLSNKLMNLWAKTNVRPEQVVADAIRDPSIAADLAKEPELPGIQVFHGTKAEGIGITDLSHTLDLGPHFTTDRATAEIFANDSGTTGKVLEGIAKFSNSLELPDMAAWFPTTVAEAVDKALGNAPLADGQTPLQAKVWEAMKAAREAKRESFSDEQKAILKADFGTPGQSELRDSMLEASNQAGYEFLKSELKGMGYDSIKYTNTFEGKPVDTFIALDMSKVEASKATPQQPKGEAVQTDLFGNDVYFRDPDVPAAYRELATKMKVDEAMLPDARAEQVLNQPFAEIPEFKTHSNINFKYVDGPDDVRAFAAKIAEEYRGEFTKQSRGVVSNEQTIIEAQRRLEDIVGKEGVQQYLALRKPGQRADAVDMVVYGDLMMDAINDAKLKAVAYAKAKGDGTVTPEMVADALMAQHKAGMTAAQFVGGGSELGRGLQMMQRLQVARKAADAIRAINDLYGGDPDMLLKMAAKMDNPYGMLQLSKALNRPNVWSKYMEAMKAGLVGHISQGANIMGSLGSMPMLPLVNLLSVPLSRMSGKERMSYWEPLAGIQGGILGIYQGLKTASVILETGVHVGDMKLDQHRVNISAEQYYKAAAQAVMENLKPGSSLFAYRVAELRGWTIGEVYRLTFRGLGAGDAVFRAMAESAEAHTLAARAAMKENFQPFSEQYYRRAAELLRSKNPEVQEAIRAAGDAITYTAPGGGIQRGVQQVLHAAPFLEPLVLFRSTPGNWVKQLIRYGALTPLGNLMVAEWRADVAAGGARQAKAISEMMVGSGIMLGAWFASANGLITGQGNPDPSQARLEKEVKPTYSFRLPGGDTWYELSRLGIIGSLVGIAADMQESRKYMTSEESNKYMKMVGVAFAHAVTDQTMLKGMVDFTRVFSEDSPRYIDRFLENMASMQLGVIPGFGVISQVAQNVDDYVREIQGPLDAMKNRIPFIRETLDKGVGPWGTDIRNRDRVLGVLPIRKFTSPDDYAMQEAARLDVGMAKAPKSVKLEGGGKFGDVELTPKQRHDYIVIAGENAYQIWKQVTSLPQYRDWPDLVREEAFNGVKDFARQIANDTVLPPEQIRVEVEKLKAKVAAELAKPPAN